MLVASGRLFFDPVSGVLYKPVVEPEGTASWFLRRSKKARGVRKNAGCSSVIDLGNGVAPMELHSKMNAWATISSR